MIQRGDQCVDTRVTLKYQAVTDKVAMDFLTHFNSFGGTSNFFGMLHTLGRKGPAAGMELIVTVPDDETSPKRNPGGNNRNMLWKGQWRYERAPKVTSLRPGSTG